MYYSLADIQFWLFAVVAIIAFIVSFYIPGWLLIRKIGFESKLTETIVSCICGVSLFAALGYLFGYLHFRQATFIYLAAALFFSWKHRDSLTKSLQQSAKEFLSLPKLTLIVVVLALVFQIYAHAGSGLLSDKGLGIYFVNSADGMLHLGYIESMTTHFPPLEPGLAGTNLTNYHFWSDLVFAELARVWRLPIVHLFFQYVPIFFIFLSIVSVIQLIRYLKGTTSTSVIALLLMTFGADAAFIFSQYFNGLWGATIPALDTGVSFIFNMPQVFSRMIFIASVLCFLNWDKTKNNFSLTAMTLMASSLFGFKIYYGFYFVLGFAFYTLFQLRKNIFKNPQLIAAWLALTILTAAIYLPTNKAAGGLLYEPLAWPKVFLSNSHFDYRDWWLRMQVYEEADNYRNITIYNAIAILITLVSIYGSRMVGFLPSKQHFSNFPVALLLFFIPANLIFIIVGFSFFQASGGLNIYNFLIVPIFSFTVFAAFSLSSIKDVTYKVVALTLVLGLCLPRTILQLNEYFQTYYSQRPTEVVSNDEIELLNYLKAESPRDAVIQADPWNEYEKITPYTSYFSGRSAYLGGKTLLATHSLSVTEREQQVNDLFKDSDVERMSAMMKQLGIQYLFITDFAINKQLKESINSSPDFLTVVKSNDGGSLVTLTN